MGKKVSYKKSNLEKGLSEILKERGIFFSKPESFGGIIMEARIDKKLKLAYVRPFNLGGDQDNITEKVFLNFEGKINSYHFKLGRNTRAISDLFGEYGFPIKEIAPLYDGLLNRDMGEISEKYTKIISKSLFSEEIDKILTEYLLMNKKEK